MYAIVDIAGQQFKVEPKQRVYVHRLEAKEGESVELNNVLLLDNNGKVSVGTPLVEGARVAAKVLAHIKGDKVLIFKKRRRKGYKKMNGHRQYFTQLFIQGIGAKGENIKLEEAPIVKAKGRDEVDEAVAEAPIKSAKKTASPKAKVASKKKTVAKKTTAKKTTKKK